VSKEEIVYDFSDEVVLITGAGQGIGEATARAFAKTGANVIIVDWHGENAENVKMDLSSQYPNAQFIAIKADVSNPDNVQAMVKQSIDTFGKIDILFNNAGVTKRGPLKDFTYEDFRYIMKVNLDGAFIVAHAVGLTMIERRKGRIINNSSMSAVAVNRGRENTVYCVSKAAVDMLTKVFAVEWIQYNVVVNGIAPGYTKTPINAQMVNDPVASKQFTDPVPLGRFAEPEEMAAAVLYLASPSTTMLVGHTIMLDGGYTIW
jgi:NAD(P)-dependent dehydrogenase (short-subunit alcohol dehydrogenase family)